MNIDITNYLSTIKHISNGSQFGKNSQMYSKQIESLQGRSNRNEIDHDIRNNSNRRILDELTQTQRAELKHDIFMDEGSEVEEEVPGPVQQLEYSPIRMEARVENDQNEEDNVG